MLNLVGVIVAFAVIIILIRKHFNFGISLLVGALIVGLFSLQIIDIIEIPKAFIEGSIYSFKEQQINLGTIELALLMIVIYILAKCMQETGAISKLIDSLRAFFSKGGILGLIPAIYGLMPVPGGALFSATLIDNEGKKFHLTQNQKNFLNVWFRHIWFPIFPVSVAMATVCSEDFSNIDIYQLVLADIPAFIAFIAIGLVFLKIFIRNETPSEPTARKSYQGVVYLLPPIVPIAFYIVGGIIIGFSNIRDYQVTIFILGVLTSIVLLNLLTKMEWKQYFTLIKKSISLNLALAIFGIMIFREMFAISETNSVIVDIMSNYSFPALLIILLIPLLLGLVIGYNLGAIVLSYFLVEPFFSFTGINIIGLTSIIFMSSLAGYLISPIHLCNVLSSEYLKTDTTRMYTMYLPAVFALLVIHTSYVIFAYAS
jgi:hypothetical protein